MCPRQSIEDRLGNYPCRSRPPQPLAIELALPRYRRARGSRMSRFRTYRRLAIDDINWPVLSTPDSGAVPGRSGYLVAPPGRILTCLSDLLRWWQTLSMAMQELPQMKWDQQKVIG